MHLTGVPGDQVAAWTHLVQFEKDCDHRCRWKTILCTPRFPLMLVKQRNIRNWLTNVKYIWRSISFCHILSFRILLTGFQQAILFNVSTSRGCYDWCFGNSFVCMQCSHFYRTQVSLGSGLWVLVSLTTRALVETLLMWLWLMMIPT